VAPNCLVLEVATLLWVWAGVLGVRYFVSPRECLQAGTQKTKRKAAVTCTVGPI
jgi:hypothetical protein